MRYGSAIRPHRVAHVTTVDVTLRFLLLGHLRRLQEEGYDVTAISAPGPWVADIEAEGIRHLAWPGATRSWAPIQDARAFGSLLQIFRRERFDLVHTHNPKPGVLGRIAGRLAGIPVVVNTVHGLYATPDSPAGRRIPVLALEWLAARLSDLEFYQSEEDLRWARRAGVVNAGKSVLLGNGIDLARFDPRAVSGDRLAELRRELGFAPEAPVVATVGRLVAEKGYREFLAAARAVNGRIPEARFLAVAPPDPEKSDGLSELEVRAAGDRVRVLGWRADVPELLALADVFVLPSWREGMPRSAIEAAAMGKAMVLTDIRGCREVAEATGAVLVPPRDPVHLAQAIQELLRDPARRQAMGREARAAAVERFDEGRVTDVVIRWYSRLLGPPSSADGVRLRRGRRTDAPALARLHRQALPGAFLPELGEPFLRILYRALAADPQAALLVAEVDGSVAGFASGVTSVPAFYRRFALRWGIAAGVAAAPRLVRMDILRRLRETSAYPHRSGSLPQAELLSIAVGPGWRRSGLGTDLAQGIVREMGRRRATQLKVVVAAVNEAGNRLYESLGFQRADTIDVHSGIPSNVWVASCPSS
jgi:glycosyltransferase involved in cell wall biosynthesis/ribosomal protein S18 acetylase RimI-like enzyme